jgi:hypothetical protein
MEAADLMLLQLMYGSGWHDAATTDAGKQLN